MMWKTLPAIALWLLAAAPARAALTADQLAAVGARPGGSATAPLDARFVDDAGKAETLGQAMGGRPTLLIFADYTCTNLCGPGLVLAAAALNGSGLKPGRDYSFVVVGLNPKDGPVTAQALRRQRLDNPAGRAAVLFAGGQADRVANALGYRYAYDPQTGQYAHDTTVYVLSPDGRVRSILPEFALIGPGLKTAVVDASEGRTDSLTDRIRLICNHLAPLTGVFDTPAIASLRVGGVAVLAVMVGGVVMLNRRRRP